LKLAVGISQIPIYHRNLGWINQSTAAKKRNRSKNVTINTLSEHQYTSEIINSIDVEKNQKGKNTSTLPHHNISMKNRIFDLLRRDNRHRTYLYLELKLRGARFIT